MELRPSSIAWGVLLGGVAVYDIACPKGETLSEGVDSLLERQTLKYVALGGIAITAAHLGNLLPDKFDPFTKALKWKDGTNTL